MTRATRTGELRPGVDIGAALSLIYSPLYAPLLFGEAVPAIPMVECTLALALEAGFAR